MNAAYLNNTGKLLNLIRSAGRLPLVEIVARSNLSPEELLNSLRQLHDDKLVQIGRGDSPGLTESEFFIAAEDAVADVVRQEHEPSQELARAHLFFSLRDRFKSIGYVPVAAL